IFWPRFGVVSETAIPKAFISTLTEPLAAQVPSSALTAAVYPPSGRRTPSSFVPSQIHVWVPAPSAAPDRWVATTSPAAFLTAQLTVAAWASANDRVVVGAIRSWSCGKNTFIELLTALR